MPGTQLTLAQQNAKAQLESAQEALKAVHRLAVIAKDDAQRILDEKIEAEKDAQETFTKTEAELTRLENALITAGSDFGKADLEFDAAFSTFLKANQAWQDANAEFTADPTDAAKVKKKDEAEKTKIDAEAAHTQAGRTRTTAETARTTVQSERATAEIAKATAAAFKQQVEAQRARAEREVIIASNEQRQYFLKAEKGVRDADKVVRTADINAKKEREDNARFEQARTIEDKLVTAKLDKFNAAVKVLDAKLEKIKDHGEGLVKYADQADPTQGRSIADLAISLRGELKTFADGINKSNIDAPTTTSDFEALKTSFTDKLNLAQSDLNKHRHYWTGAVVKDILYALTGIGLVLSIGQTFYDRYQKGAWSTDRFWSKPKTATMADELPDLVVHVGNTCGSKA